MAQPRLRLGIELEMLVLPRQVETRGKGKAKAKTREAMEPMADKLIRGYNKQVGAQYALKAHWSTRDLAGEYWTVMNDGTVETLEKRTFRL